LSNKAMWRHSRTSARHRNKTGELGRKHGTTVIGTLRTQYDPHFAEDIAESETLNDAFHKRDGRSLTKLVSDFETGQLEDIVRAGGVYAAPRSNGTGTFKSLLH
jgi:hypothetical protein